MSEITKSIKTAKWPPENSSLAGNSRTRELPLQSPEPRRSPSIRASGLSTFAIHSRLSSVRRTRVTGPSAFSNDPCRETRHKLIIPRSPPSIATSFVFSE